MQFTTSTTILNFLTLTNSLFTRTEAASRIYSTITVADFFDMQAKCFNPLNGTIYKPTYNYCIYGIKYYENSTGFNDVLYFNDPNFPWDRSDILPEEFEKAAQPLCDELHTYARRNAQHNILYYAAWVLTTKNTYDDIFFLCCKPCPMAKTEAQWRIILKLHFLIRRQYSLMKNYVLHEVTNHADGNQFYLDENYYITNRMLEINNHAKTCRGKNFRSVPITSNNNVCFVTASDFFGRISLYERQTEQMFDRTAPENVHLGPYSAANMKYMKNLKCRIQYSSLEDNECMVWMTYDKYGYECCCYGNLIGNCQDRISSTIIVGPEQLTAYNEFMACAPANSTNAKYTYKYDAETKKITLHGKMEDILDGIRSRSASKPGLSFLADQIAVGCHRYSNWDIRLADIVKMRCIQLIPLMDLCPPNVSLATNHFEALCCCNHQTFCNYNGLVLNKLNGKTHYYCKYNSQYQFLFNDLFLIDKSKSRSCLLHYIDNTTLSDLDFHLPRSGLVLFQQPGNAFYPIDFSYALLENEKCRYIEVEVNLNYTNLRSCQEATMFETNYMPLKIFACRCRTKINSKIPCDEKMTSKIGNIASRWPLSNLTQCVQYGRQKLQDMLRQTQRVFLTHTSYCYTEMTLRARGKEIEFYVSGGGVTRATVNNVRKYLDHIAYAMWYLTGSDTSLCAPSQRRKAYCFCRLYDNHMNACNEFAQERAKLQKMLMTREFLFTVRKEHPNTLSNHLIKKGETWCHSPDVYGTLDIDLESEDVITGGKCVHTKPELWEVDDDRIFCVEIKNLEDECVSKVTDTEHLAKNRLLCCCRSKCERTGFIIQTLAKKIADHLDTY
uniref:Uncharacterized protein n=1 Tax=Setaria digitata TaxID=48799 RepID=A0A915PUA8_9BILA